MKYVYVNLYNNLANCYLCANIKKIYNNIIIIFCCKINKNLTIFVWKLLDYVSIICVYAKVITCLKSFCLRNFNKTIICTNMFNSDIIIKQTYIN